MFEFLSRRFPFWLSSAFHASRKCEPIRRNQPPRVRLSADRLEDRINPSTTLNPLNGGLQIVIAGSDTVNLSTTGGKLVVNDITAGQSVIDTTGKFGVAGGTGNQTFFETANLATDFTSLTITGTGGGQTVNFIGGTFVATNVNDGTISTVAFSSSASSFSGDLNVLSKTSLTIGAAISGSDALNIIVGGTNAALNVNANVTSQYGVVNLQATGDLKIGQGVSVVSATNTLSLGADVTPAGNGDDGVGTLSIGAGASVFGTSINLRAAGVNIDPTATVGQAMATEAVLSTFVDNTHGLSQPNPLTFDGNGNLYVANGNTNSISEVTPGGVVSTFATSPLLSDPWALTFDASGNLYVAEDGPGYISKVTPAGVVSTFIDHSKGIFGPDGMAFDAHGYLYVATVDNTIAKVAPDGTVSTFLTSAQGINSAAGVAFDSNGSLYVANVVTPGRADAIGTITKVTAAGVVSTFIGTNQGLLNPRGLAFGSGGALLCWAGDKTISTKFHRPASFGQLPSLPAAPMANLAPT